MHIFGDPSQWLKDIFLRAGLSSGFAVLLTTLSLLFVVIFPGWLSNLIAKSFENSRSDYSANGHGGNGLPLQIYLFTTGYQMIPYENLQSEIFEHLIAMLNELGLKIYQNSTGFLVINPPLTENQKQ